MSVSEKDNLITLDVPVLYKGNDDEINRRVTFTPNELGGLVGCAIELINKFRNGQNVENTIIAMEETFEMLENEDDILSSPPSDALPIR